MKIKNLKIISKERHPILREYDGDFGIEFTLISDKDIVDNNGKKIIPIKIFKLNKYHGNKENPKKIDYLLIMRREK